MKAKNKIPEELQAWLADEVLPQIRKQGYYVSPDAKPAKDDNVDELLEALKARAETQDQIIKLLEQKNSR